MYARLPADIATRYVLLLDPVLGTGNSACRTIRVLLEHGVDEAKILFLCLIASPEAVHKVCGAHPAVKVVASEIDAMLDADCRVVPGSVFVWRAVRAVCGAHRRRRLAALVCLRRLDKPLLAHFTMFLPLSLAPTHT